MPTWLKWTIEVLVCFFGYGFSKSAYDLVRLPGFLKRLCRDALVIRKLAEEGKYKSDNSAVVKLVGYRKVLEIDVSSSMSAWRRGKWLPIILYFVMLVISCVLGGKFLLVFFIVFLLSFVGDGSPSAKQDVVNLVGRLQDVVAEWNTEQPNECEKYCLGEGEELFGNMYLVSSQRASRVR